MSPAQKVQTLRGEIFFPIESKRLRNTVSANSSRPLAAHLACQRLIAETNMPAKDFLTFRNDEKLKCNLASIGDISAF